MATNAASAGMSGGMTVSNPLEDSYFKMVIAVSVVSGIFILTAIGVILCWGYGRCCFGRRRRSSKNKQASDVEVQLNDSQSSSVTHLVQPGPVGDLKPPVPVKDMEEVSSKSKSPMSSRLSLFITRSEYRKF